ncbi:DUF6191 domain-containing protein [Streptomyces sp. CA2R106]|uniref:DUF6191 domain-containing protein n=1 Tax=Streptomyces sp. CA2R106 TaxID=3120153 RepID=UPI003009389B
MFDFFDELFAPGRRHTEEERNRLELTREDEGSSDPARGPIDLTSGTVTVRLPDKQGNQDKSSAGGGQAPGAGPAPAPDTPAAEDHDSPDAPAA